MQKNIIVTGVNGFVGHHLAKQLHDAGHAVIGLGHDKTTTEQNSEFIASYISCDLTSQDEVRKAINFTSIDGVIHLAGLANVGQSFSKPAYFLSANASMAINILQHALETKASSRFVVISSGAVYENKQPLPINESGSLSHGSPYAVSKLAVEGMCDYYRSRGLAVYSVRPFNHFGPGQGSGFLVPDILDQLLRYRDNARPISVGNLSTARDYTDVRDVARAYIKLVTSDIRPTQTVYNVCSGLSRSGHDVFKGLAVALGMDELPKIQVDQSLIRPNDAEDIYGDNSRIAGEFGWNPEISFEQTLNDIVSRIR